MMSITWKEVHNHSSFETQTRSLVLQFYFNNFGSLVWAWFSCYFPCRRHDNSLVNEFSLCDVVIVVVSRRRIFLHDDGDDEVFVFGGDDDRPSIDKAAIMPNLPSLL